MYDSWMNRRRGTYAYAARRPFTVRVRCRRALLTGGGRSAGPSDVGHGAQVFSQTCAACHGADGLGQRAQTGAGYLFPPLWGPGSYNIGAGMSRLLTAAAYARHNMPIGTTYAAPVLTDEDAYDVAAYLISQKQQEKA